MSEDWNTKYGTRRVKRDPPTLEEAIFAAMGITDDLDQQAENRGSLDGHAVGDRANRSEEGQPQPPRVSIRG